MLFRETPFLRLVTPLCAGVIAAEAVPAADIAAWIVISSSSAAMTGLLLRRSYSRDMLFGAVTALFLTAGGYLLHSAERKRLSSLDQDEQHLVVRLSEFPERRAGSFSFRAKILATVSDSSIFHPRGTLLLYYVDDSLPKSWQPGDRLLLRTTPLPVVNNGNPCEFNYRRYMEGYGVKYFAFINGEDIGNHEIPARRSLRETSLILARRMTDTFARAGLQGEDLGLVTALTIGEKDLLDRELLTSFSRTGAMHIMAVSGLHVGMISLLLSGLLFFMKKRLAVVKMFIILLALWAFAFVTGLTPSVLRATIMFSFFQLGALFNRQGNPLNILLVSAFFLIALRPSVLFEAGFQLSYLAVAFIIIFYEPLHQMIKIRNRAAGWIWKMMAVSLVAQAGTLALTIRLFNIFPMMFLVTNIVVIPISFAVLVLAFLLLALSPIVKLSALLVFILKSLSGITIRFTAFFASAEHAVIENIGLTTAETILLTLASALLLSALLRTGSTSLKPFLAVFCIFLTAGIAKNISETRKEGPVIYNIKGKKVSAWQSGRTLYLVSGGEDIPAEIKRHASTRDLNIEIIVTE